MGRRQSLRDGLEGMCPVCRSGGARPFFSVSGVPVFCNVLWPTREGAIGCPRGDIDLVFCDSCGHVWNSSFRSDLVEYGEGYENSLHHSPTFQRYAQSLAEALARRHQLRGKRVVDVGCGGGDFLRMLCKIGGCQGFGVDPSYGGDGQASEGCGPVRLVKDLWEDWSLEHGSDLVICRQTLEHFADPTGFLVGLRKAIDGGDTALFIEVPNSQFVFGKPSPWDVIYEHPSYFFAGSLVKALESAAFRVTDVREAFGGQYLWVEAEPAEPGSDSGEVEPRRIGRVSQMLDSFSRIYLRRVRALREELEGWRERGRTSVVWGAGSKGVAFLNAVNGEGIRYAVDINPRKHGRHVPGTGQRVVPPVYLRELQPDAIFLMNPMYEGEVREAGGELGLAGSLLYA